MPARTKEFVEVPAKTIIERFSQGSSIKTLAKLVQKSEGISGSAATDKVMVIVYTHQLKTGYITKRLGISDEEEAQ